MSYIQTDKFSASLRSRSLLVEEKKILVARLGGSEQEKDLSQPVNCRGYGRIRHFRLSHYPDWSPNPLPILPVAKALSYTPEAVLRTQVFQNAACNWRCWYCFVDFDRLSADRRVSEFFTADELVEMYLSEPNPPEVIDLSGGQPDLVPEWLFWTLESLTERGLKRKVFVWSDDNLSNRYFWEFLSPDQRAYIAAYPMYARVACFKGYNEESFSFNTQAEPELFDRQFAIYGDLLAEGLNLYAYVTFTSLPQTGLTADMARFVDRLQAIHHNLPLRTVPLKVDGRFAPLQGRLTLEHRQALRFQHDVHHAWQEELTKRFTEAERAIPICDVPMRRA